MSLKICVLMALTVKERLQLNDRMIRTALKLREAFRVADESLDAESR